MHVEKRAHDAAAMASGWRPLDDIDAGHASRSATHTYNYKLLRRFPHILFPVVAQDPREAEEPG